MTQNERLLDPDLEVVHGDELEVRDVKWLWYPYIPFGKITILEGDPGDGKSTFMLTIAALLTKGESLPFEDPENRKEPMRVIYQTTEDDAEDTVMPRFMNADGDPKMLCFIREDKKHLTFSDRRIRQAVIQENAKLLILDPMSSYIGNCSMNHANEVRAQFDHLISVSKETGCAIVIIAHLNKAEGLKAIYRTVGSIDVVGAARSTLLITKDQNEEDLRVMVQAKSNLAPTGSGIVFRLGKKIEFLEETQFQADDLLTSFLPAQPGRPDSKTREASEAIRSLLANGPVPSSRCESYLKGLNIGMTTAKKAKRLLGVTSQREGTGWTWSLPSTGARSQ